MVPDLMHEVELGVWRSIFIHLLRILESINESLLLKLDRRWVIAASFIRLIDIDSSFAVTARSLPSGEIVFAALREIVQN